MSVQLEPRLRARWWATDDDGRQRGEQVLTALRAAREGAVPLDDRDLRGLRAVDADLSGVDLSGADLRGADLSRANLQGACLAHADLRGAVLHETRLDEAEMVGAVLSGATMTGCSGVRTGLGHADLRGAKLGGACMPGASLTGADLRDCDAQAAELQGASFVGADLRGASFACANLQEADLSEAQLHGTMLTRADLRGGRLRGAAGFQRAGWLGVDLRNVDFNGAWLLRRHAMDENYIHELRNQDTWGEVVYRVWWATSDCGRSFTRWALWTVFMAVGFALIYGGLDINMGDQATWLSPLYFSVVVFTTLGFGDVLPVSAAAQAAVMAQVICGYVMLGGLMSIFSNKMARRAD